jgi:hypothetical protein
MYYVGYNCVGIGTENWRNKSLDGKSANTKNERENYQNEYGVQSYEILEQPGVLM